MLPAKSHNLLWWLSIGLTVGLSACSSTSSVTPPVATASPTISPMVTTTAPSAATLATVGQINVLSLTGRIAFSAGPAHAEDIYVINANGSGLTQLTTEPGNDFDPSWSPDGKRIAYRSIRDGNSEIFVMNADGSGKANLTNHPEEDLAPVWLPDGTKIAFSSYREGLSTMWLMDLDGSNPQRIGQVNGEYMTWSPDGTQLAFDYQTFTASEFDVWVMNADRSDAHALAEGEGSQQGAAWSPDGTKIAFQSTRDNQVQAGNLAPLPDIWIMNVDGSGQTRLTHSGGERPVWSPDGKYILFSGVEGLYVMNADGSAVTRIPVEGVHPSSLIDWTR